MVIQEFYENYWGRIESRFIDIINKGNPPPSVIEIVLYHFKNPGKRMRSFLSTGLLLCFNPKISEGELDFAASVELLHNASLIHDDLEDQDFYRRGELNVWKKYSPVQAINIGDLIFIKSIEILLASEISENIKLQLIRRTMLAINELILGQMLEISFRDTMNMTWNDWENIAAQKTGALFRLIFEGVFLISGIDIQTCGDELKGIGRVMGILYQMRDDLIDAMGLKEGRRQGSDVLEGKITCLSIKAIEKGVEKAQIVREMLLNSEQSDHDSRINRLIELYESQGILSELQKFFSGLLDQCRSHPIIIKFPQIKPAYNNFLNMLEIRDKKRGES